MFADISTIWIKTAVFRLMTNGRGWRIVIIDVVSCVKMGINYHALLASMQTVVW